MPKTIILPLCIMIVLCGFSIAWIDAFKVTNFDLEVAESKKKEWKKGSEEEHHDSGHEKKGHKEEKGYKGEHE